MTCRKALYKILLSIVISLFSIKFSHSQVFTLADTLRGSITPERSWWDLLQYDLSVTVDPSNKFISGTNIVKFKVVEPRQVMQIDLQPPLKIVKVTEENKELKFSREGNVYYIELQKKQNPGEKNEIIIQYDGNPVSAKMAPWDGGFSWKKDSNGKDFIATSCQGIGASIWWPCKDHMYDEPENMWIRITVPDNLTGVGNGRLMKTTDNLNGTKTFDWYVSNPINNYGVNVNIGDYVNFSEKYDGEKGKLDCEYYVLKENFEKAKKQFQDVPRMLKAFEYWLGPYPFYEDSYKLVEVPYLGMEHQSSVTYGNKFKNGYLGQDRSKTGWGLKFDYIIIHESGHEWFANNITYSDIADMWVHEGFTCYSENLFLEYYYGKKAGSEYVIGQREEIDNKKPIIGKYNVNQEGSGDMYCKGANILHTLRQIVNDDEKWRNILRSMNKDFYHQVVTSTTIENYLSKAIGLDLKPFFDLYLRDYRIPSFDYKIEKNKITYRWSNCTEGFSIPVKILINDEIVWLAPTQQWEEKEVKTEVKTVKVDDNFYVESMNLTNY
ncbi:MAG TPA: M1 family metallopeptidase [Bacteroidia bacterium]|nr:M1 family metallopeptidase [Bacteroidia bacterium]